MFVFFVLLWIAVPVGAVRSFYIALHPNSSEIEFTLGRVLLLIPTTIYPVFLPWVHAYVSEPTWKEFGDEPFHYMTKGSSCWIYFLPFATANLFVSISLIKGDWPRDSVLTQISLLTCLLICLLFTVGNTKGVSWAFPLSTAPGYAYGLWLLTRSRGGLSVVPRDLLVIGIWILVSAMTVLASLVKARDTIAKLPDHECFLVTAATRGHQSIVRSFIDSTSGQLTNNQLAAFRAFEAKLIRQAPRTHKVLRAIYNQIAPQLSRTVIFRWQADLVYLMLKPLEWLLRSIC
ncbi:MAG: DUF6688 family protein [Planctomyces sp.]|jgi:hypothetical protein